MSDIKRLEQILQSDINQAIKDGFEGASVKGESILDDISWLLERAKNAERMEWALNILKGRTEFHKEGQQYNYIAKQGLGEEPSPLDRKIKP